MLSATDKVRVLLSTLEEARQDWESGSKGEGWGGMPTMYTEGSYQELERALVHTRQFNRQLWWHAVHRYRYGHESWVWVPMERRDKNPHYVIPANAILRGTADHNGHQAKVLLYQWSPDVDQRLADAGVEVLKATMFGGQFWLINLPARLLSVPVAC